MKNINIVNKPERIVKAVSPLADYKVLLEFDNGEKRIYDVTPLLKFDVFAPLADISVFQQVHVIFDYTIGWNDDIDICPNCLYEHSTPI